MKRFVVSLIIIAVAVFANTVATQTVMADSLKIAPLQYDASLAKGEIKKGYVDISNPEYSKVDVSLQVQAFRQIADDGSLEFYDDVQVTSGVKLDLNEVTIGPRKAERVYFLLDGSKLPSGNVFAAIFASTTPDSSAGSQQSVRVGTLLAITNGTPPAQTADVAGLSASWFQFGDGLFASITLHNPKDEKSFTGFFPEVTIKAQPYSETTSRGPLLFAGRSRTLDYKQAGNYFGPILITADASGASKSQLVFAVTGYWMWLAPLLLVVILGLVYLLHMKSGRRLHSFRGRK